MWIKSCFLVSIFQVESILPVDAPTDKVGYITILAKGESNLRNHLPKFYKPRSQEQQSIPSICYKRSKVLVPRGFLKPELELIFMGYLLP